ncbi:MAG: carbohydrate-binding domain-containing protein, partial [Clostridia bacterium]|nr:carbohydrate-binding domain-containing protein [Clostridia bacterium]
LYTNDDGVHADGTLAVYGGDITVGGSYEGLEGEYVTLAGGDISITSSDDGVNGTCTSGVGITVSGGTLYVYAGGDGLDSNSKDRYAGILISGGRSVVISTSNANSSIDNENGYRYEGGYILGIGMSGGMSKEASNCQEFTSNGTSKTISLTKGNFLVVDGYVTVQMPVSISAYVVFLCEKSGVSITSEKSVSTTMDSNGIYWKV